MDNSDCKTESRFPVQKLAYRMESNCVPIHQWSNNDPLIEHPYNSQQKNEQTNSMVSYPGNCVRNCNWNVFWDSSKSI